VEIGEANADRYSPARPEFRPEACGDPVGEVTQCGPENLLFRRLSSERRLRSGRLGAVMGPDFPRITIPCQRAKLLSDRTTDYLLQTPS